MSTERIAKARELFERFPNNELSRYSLAQALFDAGMFPEAADHLRQLCAAKANWMVVRILLGKCLLHTGASDEAKQMFEQAYRLAVEQHHDGPREELSELLKTL